MYSQLTRAGSRLSLKELRTGRLLHSSALKREHFFDASCEMFKSRIAQKDRLVLVDFYAKSGTQSFWDLQLKDILEQLDGKDIDLITVDTESEEHVPLAVQHKIRALPTVVAYKNGERVDEFVGALPEEDIKRFIEKQ